VTTYEARPVPIGRVLHPHGTAGEMLCEPYLDDWTWYDRLGELALLLADGRWQSYRVQHTRRAGERLLLRLEGCLSLEMARPLVGLELYVERAGLPTPREGEFYWFDLEGLTVYTQEDEYLGRVEEFFPTGSNEVLVVRKGSQEMLLPFIKDVIVTVDDTRRILYVRLIPGLL
jgi:16S rRNA processing protein RimM